MINSSINIWARRSALAAAALLLALGLLSAGGCAAPTYTFEVMVHNHSADPITLWLTKDGPPMQQQWLSPEDLAEGQFPQDVSQYSQIVPPHSVAMAGPRKGQFPAGVHPVLRVYEGALKKLPRILAVSRGSPDRLDLILQQEGRNEYIIDETNGKLTCTYIPQPKAKK